VTGLCWCDSSLPVVASALERGSARDEGSLGGSLLSRFTLAVVMISSGIDPDDPVADAPAPGRSDL